MHIEKLFLCFKCHIFLAFNYKIVLRHSIFKCNIFKLSLWMENFKTWLQLRSGYQLHFAISTPIKELTTPSFAQIVSFLGVTITEHWGFVDTHSSSTFHLCSDKSYTCYIWKFDKQKLVPLYIGQALEIRPCISTVASGCCTHKENMVYAPLWVVFWLHFMHTDHFQSQ